MKKKIAIFDTECYRNYFLIAFKTLDGQVTLFERTKTKELDIEGVKKIMDEHVIVGFNSENYDMPMISYALDGAKNSQLKKLSDTIIVKGLRSWEVYNRFAITHGPPEDHVDIFEVAPGVKTSLKLYGGRLHCPKMQDLPYEPDVLIDNDMRRELRAYCVNDLDVTIALFKSQFKQLKLRTEITKLYGIDVRSKSDAQIAEAVFKVYLKKDTSKDDEKNNSIKASKPDINDDYEFKYEFYDYIQFRSDELNEIADKVKETTFELYKNRVVLPDTINKAFTFNEKKYKFGIGGLHSQETKQIVKENEHYMLFDLDVASYYPAIIINNNLYPKHLTEKFLNIYTKFRDDRIKAKRTGDKTTTDTYKIFLNGSYGKFGSHYSFLFSPDLLIQTTITGQLCLLMLIEQLELIPNVQIKSANTDGIVVYTPKSMYELVKASYHSWEKQTGFELEETHYKALYSRDVNNYLAVKKDGGTKGKGVFAAPSLMKNPQYRICYNAVAEYLTNDKPIEQTIKSCTDITQFVVVRTVKGGGTWKGEYLGKVVRWYYSFMGESIHYKSNNNKVATSDGAIPCMDLPQELPFDVDYNKYIEITNGILEDIGVKKNERL